MRVQSNHSSAVMHPSNAGKSGAARGTRAAAAPAGKAAAPAAAKSTAPAAAAAPAVAPAAKASASTTETFNTAAVSGETPAGYGGAGSLLDAHA